MPFKRSLTDNQKKAAMVGVIALVVIGLFATYVLLYSGDEGGESDGGSQMRAGVGDRGHGGHGSGGRGGGCFSQGTLVVMADGQTKQIEQIRPGEVTLEGGLVRATITFVASEATPIYLYRGVHVTGDHAVRLGDGTWRRAAHAPGAVLARLEPTELYLYDLITAHHRLMLVGRLGEQTLFADYEEIDDTDADLGNFLHILEREDGK